MAEAAHSPPKSKLDYVLTLWSHLQKRISDVMKEETTFEQLTKFMANSKNIKLTASFYTMLSSFCTKSALNKTETAANTKKARLILSALMIEQYPLDVLDVADLKDLDPASEDTYNAATNMIAAILGNDEPINHETVHKLKCDELLNCVNQFIEKFGLWKDKDLEKVIDSVVNYYTQWMRSYKVLSQSSMNEAQKKIILNQLVENMNRLQTKISKLVGIKRAETICQEIRAKVNAEPDLKLSGKPNANANANAVEAEEEEKKMDLADDEDVELSMKEKLAAKGIPMNIKSGKNLLKEKPKLNNEEEESKINEADSKYFKEINGQKVLDLDQVVMEEASKRYWNDFAAQILQNDFSRLFELLGELLERIKKISPEKEHAHLKDLMDVAFIQQTIQNGAIDAKAFYGIFYGIWSHIKSLHSPIEDKNWQEWHDHIVQQFGSDDATWGTLLCDVFNIFLFKMDRIEDQIKAINEIKNEKKIKN